MAIDFLSWLLGFSLTKASSAILNAARKTDIWSQMDKATQVWAKSLPAGFEIYPQSLALYNNPEDFLTPEIKQFVEKLLSSELPSKEDIYDALLSRYRIIRKTWGNQTQPFFQKKEEEVGPSLLALASSLFDECVKQDGIFKKSTIEILTTLLNEGRTTTPDYSKDIALLIEERSEETIAAQRKTLKYIPAVYTEINHHKETLRWFVDPVVFWKKYTRDLRKEFAFRGANKSLYKLCQQALTLDHDQFPEAVKLHFIQDNARKVRKTLGEFLVNSLNCSKEALDETVSGPARTEYYDYIKYTWPKREQFERTVDESKKELFKLTAHVLHVVSRAGQGKTNFVCDLYETVLKPRGVPTLFLTARDFNRADLKDLKSHLMHIACRSKLSLGWGEFLQGIEELAKSKQKPFIIIIDGLNEHSHISDFSEALLELLAEFVRFQFIKVIITCRSEYYDRRFGNLARPPLDTETIILREIHSEMEERDAEELVTTYLEYFRIGPLSISIAVRDQLAHDPFLLRVFCEAYGDHTAQSVKTLPYIGSIHREDLFKTYFDRKTGTITDRDSAKDPLEVKTKTALRSLLIMLADTMIETESYGSIPLELLLNKGGIEEITTLIDEDILLRRDLRSAEGTILSDLSEVVSFTFDEFRDYVIASRVVDRNRGDSSILNRVVIKITDPMCPAAEGVSRFLFMIERRVRDSALTEVVRRSPWYETVYLECVFSLDDRYIEENDLLKVRNLFCKSVEATSFILRRMLRRYDEGTFKSLTARTLVDWLLTIETDDYQLCVVPNCSPLDRSYGYQSAIPVNLFAEDLRALLDTDTISRRPYLHVLFNLLLLLLPCARDHRSHEAVVRVYLQYAEQNSKISLEQLARARQSRCELVRASALKHERRVFRPT